jgi:thiol:disulfide interchange protein
VNAAPIWAPIPRRWAVMVYALAMFGALSIGLIAVQLSAEAAGRGGKAGWEWAVPFAALVCLLPVAAFALTLSLAARHGLARPRWRVSLLAAVCGAATPLLLFGVKPLLRLMHAGSDLFSGLAVSQLGLCAVAVVSAVLLAKWLPSQ